MLYTMDHIDSAGDSKSVNVEDPLSKQTIREQKRAGVSASLLEDDVVESLARLGGSTGDASTAKIADANSNHQNSSQPLKSPGLMRRGSSTSMAKRKRRSSAGQPTASVLLMDSYDEEDRKQKPSKKNTTKATSKRKNKSNKRSSDTGEDLDASTMPFRPRRGDDSEFYRVYDLDERRLVNPLAEWPDMQHEFNPMDHKPKPSAHAAEIMPLMNLWMPIPDTFSLAYQARLLGFHIEAPAPIHRLQNAEQPTPLPSNLQFIRETEQGEDSYEFVPPLGQFANQVWLREESRLYPDNQFDSSSTEDIRVLGNHADPLYTSLCNPENSVADNFAAIQLSQRTRLVSAFAKAKPKFGEMLSNARLVLNVPGKHFISSSWSFCSINEYIKVYPNLSHLKQSKLCALMLLPEPLAPPPASPDRDDPNFKEVDENVQQAKPVPIIEPLVTVWYDFVWYNFSADQAGVILQIFDITFGSVSENQSFRSLWHESSPDYLQSLSFELQAQIILSLCAVLDHARTANVYYATVEKVPKAWTPFWDEFFRSVGVEYPVRKASEKSTRTMQQADDSSLTPVVATEESAQTKDDPLTNKKSARPAKMGVTSVLETLDGSQTSHSTLNTQNTSNGAPFVNLQNNHLSQANGNPVSVLDMGRLDLSTERKATFSDNSNKTLATINGSTESAAVALKDNQSARADGQSFLNGTSKANTPDGLPESQQIVMDSTKSMPNEQSKQLPSHDDSAQMIPPNKKESELRGNRLNDEILPTNSATEEHDLGSHDKIIERIRVVADLSKCNSQLALLSLQRATSNQIGRWQSYEKAHQESMKSGRVCFRSLVRFPNVNDALAMTQSNPSGRRGRPSTRRVSEAFSSAKDELQNSTIGICAKFSPDTNQVVGFARLNTKTKEAVNEIKVPNCEEEPQLEVLRTFQIEFPPQTEDADDEILNEMKRLQNEVKELEIGLLEPKSRVLMDRIISERMTFEKAKPHETLEEEKKIVAKLRHIQAKRQALVEEQQKQLEQDMDAVCSICNDGEVTPDNQILFCDTCDVPVHQFCYGIDKIPSGDYYCMACRHLGRDKKGRRAFLNKTKTTAIPLPIVCELCPVQRGAFIRTAIKNEEFADPNGKWIHAVCAKWQGLNYVENQTNVLEDVTEMRMNFRREGIKCELCLGERGCMNKCAVEGCRKWLHVTCARVSGKCEVRHGEDCDGAVVENAWQLKCPSHSEVSVKPEDRERLVPVEKLIDIAKSLPPEPTPPPKPVVVEYKAFNEASLAEQRLLLNDPKYEKMMIDELLNKRSAGIRCEVCDNPCDNRKNYIRCQTCKETVCRGCLQEFDEVSGNALCFKCKKGGERPTCCACGYKHGPLRECFAKPTSAKTWQGSRKKKLLERSLFGTAKWIHHLCGLWHPKVGFPPSEDDPNHKKLDLSQVVLGQGRGFIQDSHPCFVCGRNYGLKVKCSPSNECSCSWLDQDGAKHPTYFHISCARIAGLEVEENLDEVDEKGNPFGPYVRCYRHAGNEFNIRAKLEDLFEIEKTRKKPGSDRPLTFVDGARMMNSALIVVRIMGWAWRWAEWWVEYDSSWEPFLEPHQNEKDMTKEELRIVDSTKESRCQDARRCRLAAFGAALRDRLYDDGDDFDREALDRAFRAILNTRSLVGPLTDEEIDFHADWLGRAYRSKSRLLCLGDDKLPVDSTFCVTVREKTPKYLIEPTRAPGKDPLEAGLVFEPLDNGDKDDFLLVKMVADEKQRPSPKSDGRKRKRSKPEHSEESNGDNPPPKRPRGRPPKKREPSVILNQPQNIVQSTTDQSAPESNIATQSSTGKRRPGRPPKKQKSSATQNATNSALSKKSKSAQQPKREDPSYFREFKKSRRGIYNAPESLGGDARATTSNEQDPSDAQSSSHENNGLLLPKALEGHSTSQKESLVQESAQSPHRADEKKTSDKDPSDFQAKEEALASSNVENRSTGDDSDAGFGFASIASDRSDTSARISNQASDTTAPFPAPPLPKQILGLNRNEQLISSQETDAPNAAKTGPAADKNVIGGSAVPQPPIQDDEKQNLHQSAKGQVKQVPQEEEVQTENTVDGVHDLKQSSKRTPEAEKNSTDDHTKASSTIKSRRDVKGKTKDAVSNNPANTTSEAFDPTELPQEPPLEGRRPSRNRRKPDAFVPEVIGSPSKELISKETQNASNRSFRGRRRKIDISVEPKPAKELQPGVGRRRISRVQKDNSREGKAKSRKTETQPSNASKKVSNASESLSSSKPPRRSTRRVVKEPEGDQVQSPSKALPQRPRRNAGRRSTLKDPDSDEDGITQDHLRSKPLKRLRNGAAVSNATPSRKNGSAFPGIIFPKKSVPDSDSSSSGSESDPEDSHNSSESLAEGENRAENQDEDVRSDPAKEESSSTDEYVEDEDREPTPPRTRGGAGRQSRRRRPPADPVRRSGRLSK